MTWPYRGGTYYASDFLRWDGIRDDLRAMTRPLSEIDRENLEARTIPGASLGADQWMVTDRGTSDSTVTYTQASSSRGLALFTVSRRSIVMPAGMLNVYGRVDLEKLSASLADRVVRAGVGIRINGRVEAIRHPQRGLRYQPHSVRVVRPMPAGTHVVELLLVIAEPYREASTSTPSDVSVDSDGFALHTVAMVT